MRNKDVSQDAQSSHDQRERLGEPSAHIRDGEHRDEFGGNVDRPKHQLGQVDVEIEILQVHGQPIISKAGGKPRMGGENWKA